MATNPVYLKVSLTADGVIDSVEGPDGTRIISEDSLMETPLALGDKKVGEFKTIVLVKLIAPDGSYTWMVKPSSEYCLWRCTRYEPPESMWVKTEEKTGSEVSSG